MNKNGHKSNEVNGASMQDGFDQNAKLAETNGQATPGMPTDRRYLHIGEGGSGGNDVLRRKQVMSVGGWSSGLQSSMRYLVIDNDTKLQTQFEPGEFIGWGEVPVGDFIRAKLAHPELFPELNRFGDLEALLKDLQPFDIIANGCRANRVIGGLVYEFMSSMHGDQLVSDLMTPIYKLCGVVSQGATSDDKQPQNNRWEWNSATQQLIISQSFSAAGAKGSASAVQDAWLFRAKLQDMGITNFRIDCTIFLPETFNASRQQQKRNQAHAEAWFQELKALHFRKLEPLQIAGVQVVRTIPYTLIKLMNGVAEGGNQVYTQDDVYEISAATSILSGVGAIANHLESLIPNIIDGMRWPCIAYSQNCHFLVLPIRELQTQFGYRLVNMVLLDYLLRKPSATDNARQGKNRARDWLTRRQVTPQNLNQLLHHEAGLQLQLDLKEYRKLPLVELQKVVARFEQTVFKAFAQRLHKRVEEVTKQLSQNLIEEIEGILAQENGGIHAVRYFLAHDPKDEMNGLQTYLAELHLMLTKRFAQHQLALQKAREQLKAPKKWIHRILPAWIANHKRRWMKRKQHELSLQVTEQSILAQLRLVEHLQQVVHEHLSQVVTWVARLEQASRIVEQQQSQFDQQRLRRPVYETNILSLSEEQSLFNQRSNGAFAVAAQNLSWKCAMEDSNSPSSWILQVNSSEKREVHSDEIAESTGLSPVTDMCRNLFLDLSSLDIEQVLLDQKLSPTDVIEMLKVKSPVLVGIDTVADRVQQGTQTPGLRREIILGTPHGSKGFFRSVQSSGAGFQIVDTGEQERHRIAILNSLFNINPFALTQSAAYRSAYEELKAAGHPLHIFAEEELFSGTETKTVRTKGRKTYGS